MAVGAAYGGNEAGVEPVETRLRFERSPLARVSGDTDEDGILGDATPVSSPQGHRVMMGWMT